MDVCVHTVCLLSPDAVPADACQVTPANLTAAITVAASDQTDTRWSHSNYGSCVDLYAPGVAVSSASHISDIALVQATGTSMASSHVTGVVALYLQDNPTASPAEVRSAGFTSWMHVTSCLVLTLTDIRACALLTLGQ